MCAYEYECIFPLCIPSKVSGGGGGCGCCAGVK